MRDRLIAPAGKNADTSWAVGYQDERRWSRVALPTSRGRAEKGEPPRFVRRSVAEDDPDREKAISCYGPHVPRLEETWLEETWLEGSWMAVP